MRPKGKSVSPDTFFTPFRFGSVAYGRRTSGRARQHALLNEAFSLRGTLSRYDVAGLVAASSSIFRYRTSSG